MTNITKFVFIAAFTAILAACSGSPNEPGTGESLSAANLPISDETRLAAVLVYADWCGSCKILDPKLQQAKAEGPIDGVQHIVLNYTDRNDDAFFASADELGLGVPIRANLGEGINTGVLLLVDIDDGKVVADLRKGLSAAEIRSAMVAAAAAA